MKNTAKRFIILLALLMIPLALAEDVPTTADPVDAPVAESAADLSGPDDPILMEAVPAADFPDANFRACLLAQFDADGDQALSDAELAAVAILDVSDAEIADLTGIERLPRLKELVCYGNALTSLDLSALTLLEELYCYDNPLASLDVSRNVNLRALYCDGNGLTALDVSMLTKLEELYCYDNALTALDVSNCPNLRELDCHHNRLTALDVSRNPKLTILDATVNPLTTLDISNCPTLVDIVDKDGNPPWYIDAEAGASTREVHYQRWVVEENGDDACYGLACNADVQIIGGNPAAPLSSPEESVFLTIDATRRTNRAKITAGPGSVYRLDLGGAAGKGFKSSKKKVATVDAAGCVTVKGGGRTKITFRAGKKKRAVILTVKDPTVPARITLNLSGTQSARVGEVVTLVYILPQGAQSGVKWKTSNKKVATVRDGIVYFKKAGRKPVTITAITTRGKRKAKVKFRVRE